MDAILASLSFEQERLFNLYSPSGLLSAFFPWLGGGGEGGGVASRIENFLDNASSFLSDSTLLVRAAKWQTAFANFITTHY